MVYRQSQTHENVDNARTIEAALADVTVASKSAKTLECHACYAGQYISTCLKNGWSPDEPSSVVKLQAWFGNRETPPGMVGPYPFLTQITRWCVASHNLNGIVQQQLKCEGYCRRHLPAIAFGINEKFSGATILIMMHNGADGHGDDDDQEVVMVAESLPPQLEDSELVLDHDARDRPRIVATTTLAKLQLDNLLSTEPQRASRYCLDCRWTRTNLRSKAGNTAANFPPVTATRAAPVPTRSQPLPGTVQHVGGSRIKLKRRSQRGDHADDTCVQGVSLHHGDCGTTVGG